MKSRSKSLAFVLACLASFGLSCAESGGETSANALPAQNGATSGNSNANARRVIALDGTQASSSDEATAATDADLYTAASPGIAIFENQGVTTLYLAGCSPFNFERSIIGAWVDVGVPFVCIWEGFAFPVHPDEVIETDIFVPNETGIYRIRYGVASGCDPDLPLSQANCDREFEVYSDEFQVERELCDVTDFGCQFIPAAPNAQCANGVDFDGPATECTFEPVSQLCGYEVLICP